MSNNPEHTTLSPAATTALVHNLIQWILTVLSQEVLIVATEQTKMVPALTLDRHLIMRGYEIIKPYIDLEETDPQFLTVVKMIESGFLDRDPQELINQLHFVNNDTEVGHC